MADSNAAVFTLRRRELTLPREENGRSVRTYPSVSHVNLHLWSLLLTIKSDR